MLVTYSDLKGLGVDLGPKYIRQLVRDGKFPKPVSGGRDPKKGPFKWRESDIKKYVEIKNPVWR